MPSVDSKERLLVLGDFESVQREARVALLSQLSSMLLNGEGKGEEAITLICSLFGKRVVLTHTEIENQVRIEMGDQADKRILDPEVQAKLLVKLQLRFVENAGMHEGVKWSQVQRSLEADPAKLWCLQQMETSEHAPDVYREDDEAYYFGTCSVETPLGHRDIVYDAAAEKCLRKKRPQETCNGNAVDIAAAMGIDLMDRYQYRDLQALGLGRFDAQTTSWLKTCDEIKKSGCAYYGHSGFGSGKVLQGVAASHDPYRGFRGSLRVSKA